MSARELVVLGTSSQAPTRYRNHNGYLLRWDDQGFLFDPGEGTQRQLLLAGVRSSSITTICITHFHGDHCFGLPGVLGRLALDDVVHPVVARYPASGQEHFDRLRHAGVTDRRVDLRAEPVAHDGVVTVGPPAVRAARLDHRADAVGWRIEEPDGRRMLPGRLDALGVRGPAIGQLQRQGAVTVDGRTVRLEEVSEHRPGQAMAFVMDTRLCDAAFELADAVDLLVCEATYLDADADLAERYGHLTAGQAGRLAAESHARRLVLTHFSARYTDEAAHAAEAATHHPDVIAAHDLLVVPVPPRAG